MRWRNHYCLPVRLWRLLCLKPLFSVYVCIWNVSGRVNYFRLLLKVQLLAEVNHLRIHSTLSASFFQWQVFGMVEVIHAPALFLSLWNLYCFRWSYFFSLNFFAWLNWLILINILLFAKLVLDCLQNFSVSLHHSALFTQLYVIEVDDLLVLVFKICLPYFLAVPLSLKLVVFPLILQLFKIDFRRQLPIVLNLLHYNVLLEMLHKVLLLFRCHWNWVYRLYGSSCLLFTLLLQPLALFLSLTLALICYNSWLHLLL